MVQFATAKAFADFMISKWGKAHHRELNKKDINGRIGEILFYIERYERYGVKDGGIEFGYNNAAYGLQWSLVTGRLNGQASEAIGALKTRGILELIHELKNFDHNISLYPQYLMRKYAK